MEKIETHSHTPAMRDKFEDGITIENQVKNKIKKGFLSYAGVFIGVLLMFTVVVIVTTDISITSFEDKAALGLDFFLLFFCSYSMYINCSDSGMRAGIASNTYIDALAAFEKQKQVIVDRKLQDVLPDFCRKYIADELRKSRTEILTVVGISYERYLDEFLSVDDASVDVMTDISKSQREAIKKANAIKPIKLTPEMITKCCRGSYRRSPLGLTPQSKKTIKFSVKFATSFFIALVMVMMALEVVIEQNWIMLASYIPKLLAVAMNGFTGYKFGYENIVFDTVNYMSDQIDLMRQAVNYADSCSFEN